MSKMKQADQIAKQIGQTKDPVQKRELELKLYKLMASGLIR